MECWLLVAVTSDVYWSKQYGKEMVAVGGNMANSEHYSSNYSGRVNVAK